jgi:glycine/D-amino acid oxidase-like deaminating enzyme
MTATVILGSGIIGVSTAYYLSLSQQASSIHLVEPSTKLFASASGFAGGFLASDWFSPSVSALGKLSFEEHSQLAQDFGGREKWGYLKSKGLSYTAGRGKATKTMGGDWLRRGTSRTDATMEDASGFVGGEAEDDGPRWLQRNKGDSMELISEDGTTAQLWVRRVTAPIFNSIRVC